MEYDYYPPKFLEQFSLYRDLKCATELLEMANASVPSESDDYDAVARRLCLERARGMVEDVEFRWNSDGNKSLRQDLDEIFKQALARSQVSNNGSASA